MHIPSATGAKPDPVAAPSATSPTVAAKPALSPVAAPSAPSPTGATPAMAQWFALKAECPDALLFFRMGDFYEMFFADAQAAATALDIALTYRGEHAGQKIPMCGVPVSAADAYLARLIRRGFRVGVAEQMDPPGRGKAPIRRALVRLITPGTLTDEALLDPARPNLLLALATTPAGLGAAWLDISTGQFATLALPPAGLPALLGRLDPAEILSPPGLDLGEFAARRAPFDPHAATAPTTARARLASAFLVASIDAFGSFTDAEATAAMAALDYLRATQAGKLPRLSHPEPTGPGGVLALDAATRASLELTRARDGGTDHTLLAAIDRTASAAGTRLLADWLAAPLTDPAAIAARQDGWAWLVALPDRAAALRAALRGAPDLARALARIALARFSPRDLSAMRDGLAVAAQAAEALAPPDTAPHAPPTLLAGLDLRPLPDLAATLTAALADPAPARLDDGGAIRAGFDGQLDAQRALRDDSRQRIAALQADLATEFGVASLKIRHHQQLGYVLEAPAVAVEKLRAHPALVLRQGMANGARFTHPAVAELDRAIAEATEQAARRERVIIDHLAGLIRADEAALARLAGALALLDVLAGAAALAQGGRWCRAQVEAGTDFIIEAGRHPVVEAALPPGARFVPNRADLSTDRRVMLLTGPNMAGKSTFLRQCALIVVLAQAGLPVPADTARIGIVDRLFSRVGAADDLARGRSTFMVEMTETAAILNQAGPRSLVVVDEIGRGTSTLDGLAIAWAVLEALAGQVRCRTIFATHFHELGGLAGQLPGLAPHTMRVRQWQGSVVFLHEVAAGAAGRSWGVHVAQLAGVPAAVVRRAGAILAALEREHSLTAPAALPLFAAAAPPEPESMPEPEPEPEPEPDPLRAALAALDPDRLTPREALESLYQLRALIPVAKQHE